MGILKSVGNFLFGKDPDIFDENGRVRHKFPESKWTGWNDRLAKNSAYDWRQHGAQERATNPGVLPTPSNTQPNK